MSDLEHSTDDALQKKGVEISNWLPEARKVLKEARGYLSAAKAAKKDQIDKDMVQVAEAHVSTVSEIAVTAKEKVRRTQALWPDPIGYRIVDRDRYRGTWRGHRSALIVCRAEKQCMHALSELQVFCIISKFIWCFFPEPLCRST